MQTRNVFRLNNKVGGGREWKVESTNEEGLLYGQVVGTEDEGILAFSPNSFPEGTKITVEFTEEK